MILVGCIMHQIILTSVLLPFLKPMGQSRRGVMETQAHPLIMAIPRFIQISMPLPPLKPMGQ
ncbi:hypothetical protein BSPLISOX_1658 [uncultured Gammaproteobacteria bacterium]|nr:hypothetical protein BSPLISOX_1658 [uncultured Gammaproteobacteria bacterium]